MLQLIAERLPAPLHRLGLRLAHAVRTRWWRWRRPLVVGVRVLAVNPLGEVLLIRHSYGSRGWMLPGGGVARGETPIVAATRELVEETACMLTCPVEIATTRRIWHGATNLVHIVAGQIHEIPRADGREIVTARCFALTALPVDIGNSLAADLTKWVGLIPQNNAS